MLSLNQKHVNMFLLINYLLIFSIKFNNIQTFVSVISYVGMAIVIKIYCYVKKVSLKTYSYVETFLC